MDLLLPISSLIFVDMKGGDNKIAVQKRALLGHHYFQNLRKKSLRIKSKKSSDIEEGWVKNLGKAGNLLDGPLSKFSSQRFS